MATAPTTVTQDQIAPETVHAVAAETCLAGFLDLCKSQHDPSPKGSGFCGRSSRPTLLSLAAQGYVQAPTA